ncbi:hypothetical protein [Streptomyces sp. NPDC058653]|uniref:hypothetical protein n=1 Tax=Streptomyces sp. NPDC058653 TaxID=3346576 RepID=UPI00364701DE
MDSNLELAAEAGDPTAMRMFGKYLFHGPDQKQDSAGRWLPAAVEAGDAEAMDNPHCFLLV